MKDEAAAGKDCRESEIEERRRVAHLPFDSGQGAGHQLQGLEARPRERRFEGAGQPGRVAEPAIIEYFSLLIVCALIVAPNAQGE